MNSFTIPQHRFTGVSRPRWTASEKTALFWILGLLVVQTVCQLGLLFEFLSPFRVGFRIAAYAVTLGAFVFASNSAHQKRHPAFWAATISFGILSIQFLNPSTNTVMSAVASLLLNLAIVSPLLWVPRLTLSTRTIRTAIIFMWAFHSLSSVFGVLQVYFPGQYQPALSQAVKDQQHAGENLKVTLASGEYVYRPMGLTDIPGGASMAGMYAFLFGIGLLSNVKSKRIAVLGFLSLPLGMFCIYLSHVRSILILMLIVTFSYLLILLATRCYAAAVRVAFAVPLVLILGFFWALALGGESMRTRFESLVQENPAELYSKNRGQFLNETFEAILPDYPFGAGLGRWGMMHAYFGDSTLPDSSMIWVEIQWTAWVVDGGVLLLTSYLAMLGLTLAATGKVAFGSADPELAGWARIILAYDISMIMLTFSYCPFLSQSGIEFFLLNAMLYAAYQRELAARRRWLG